MNLPTSITIRHDSFGLLSWRILTSLPSGVLLFAEPVLQGPFSDISASTPPRFLHTKSNTISESALDDDGNGNQQLYANLCDYGCNQWPVSALREYLNGPFFTGLPPSFRQAIIPRTNTLLIAQTQYKDKAKKGTSSAHIDYDATVSIWDEYSAKPIRVNRKDPDDITYLRNTFCSVTDNIFLPTYQNPDISQYYSDLATLTDGPHFWTMDARRIPMNNGYLVDIVVVCKDLSGKYYARFDYCNAAQRKNIFARPVCIVNQDYFN